MQHQTTMMPGVHRCFFAFRIILLALLCVASVGCSSFNQQWAQLGEGTTDAPVAGGSRWEGLWRSAVSNHEGKLRCMVLPQEGDASLFRFSATWGPGIVSNYDIEMQTQRTPGGGMTFEGNMDLGWLMGDYRTRGQIVGDAFNAKYESDQDHGIFEMTRVK